MRLSPLILGAFLLAPAAAQRPSPEEQQRILNAARQAALNYNATLPDFICNEMVQRVESIAGARNTKADKLTIQLSYFGRQEKYKVVALNGNRTDQPLESLGGLISGGEFGSLLLRVFEPSSAAAFEWKSWSSLRKHRAAVYAYHVARDHSHYVLGYRSNTGELVATTAGYHGEVAIDSEMPRVLRLTAKADDVQKESGILSSSMEVDYDFIDVGGRSFLLPARAEAHMSRPHRETSNVVTFADYRKFEADSKIDFAVPKLY